MSKTWCECWKCDLCGHTWIAVYGKAAPRQCAKCRKLNWDSGGRVESGPDTSQVRASLSVAGATPAPCAKPDMDALRAIAAGKTDIAAARALGDAGIISGSITHNADEHGRTLIDELIDDPCALGIQDALSDVPDPCEHIEYDWERGESYHCALIAGHKGKCVRGERV